MRRKVEQESRVYERDGDLVYVSGFERHITQQEIQEFISQHGTVTQFDYLTGKQQSHAGGKGRDNRRRQAQPQQQQPYCFVKFETIEMAEAFVAQD